MNVVLSLRFIDDLDVIKENYMIPKDFHKKILSGIKSSSDNPTMFQPYQFQSEKSRDYYRFKVGSYLIFYTVVDNDMRVERVLSGRMNLEKQFSSTDISDSGLVFI